MTVVFSDLKKNLLKELDRFRNRTFLEATMAVSALLAMADGEVSVSEHLARDYVLDNVRELKIYDVHKAVDMFRSYVETIKANRKAGKEKVFHFISKFSGDVSHATVLIRAGVLIAKADGNFSKEEEKIIGELCHMLQLEASQTICTNSS
jgi:tellurite resistance protein TerB